MNEYEKYVDDNFFNAQPEPRFKGNDAFGYALYEGDEVFVYETDEQKYLLIEKMNPTQKAMARVLGLRKAEL